MSTLPRILVVDDEPAILEALSDVLAEEGFAVDTALNGALALQRLEAGPRPDALLTDIMMPVMDGRALVAELRRREGLRDLPVIVMSAGVVHPRERDGFAHFLAKPFELVELLGVLGRLRGDGDTRRPG